MCIRDSARPQRNADDVSKLRSIDGATRIVQRIDCVGAGNRGCAARRLNYIKTRRAVVEVADFAAPAVSITGGDLVGGGWVKDTRSLQISAGDNTGVRSVRARIGSTRTRTETLSCNTALIRPCANGPLSLSVDVNQGPEGCLLYTSPSPRDRS